MTARETFRRLVDGLRDRNSGSSRPWSGDRIAHSNSPRIWAPNAPGPGSRRRPCISAVRLDFSILWADLLQIADPEDAALLASRVDRVWRVVDQFATRTHTSYSDRTRAHGPGGVQHPPRIHCPALQPRLTLRGDRQPRSPPPSASDLTPDSASWLPVATPQCVSERPRPAAAPGQQPAAGSSSTNSAETPTLFWPLPPRRPGTPPEHALIPAAFDRHPLRLCSGGVAGLRACPRPPGRPEALACPAAAFRFRAPVCGCRLGPAGASSNSQDVGLDLLADLEAACRMPRRGTRAPEGNRPALLVHRQHHGHSATAVLPPEHHPQPAQPLPGTDRDRPRPVRCPGGPAGVVRLGLIACVNTHFEAFLVGFLPLSCDHQHRIVGYYLAPDIRPRTPIWRY